MDALSVDTSSPGQGGCAFLFVVLVPGHALDDATRAEIHRRCLLAHGRAPDAVYPADELPRGQDGEPSHAAVRRVMSGEPAARVAAEESVANPGSLGFFAWLFNNL